MGRATAVPDRVTAVWTPTGRQYPGAAYSSSA